MSSERPTIRPVTLSRLAETSHACTTDPVTTAEVEERIDVSRRRARTVLLEAERIGLIEVVDQDANTTSYTVTSVGRSFVDAVVDERWGEMSKILTARSPHYRTFLDTLEETYPIKLSPLLNQLQEATEFTPYRFNKAGVEVVGGWAERLGEVNRNAFTGAYYPVAQANIPEKFPFTLLAVFDDLESDAGVDLRQRYLSIPELRETVCERLQCSRAAFDEALVELVRQNVGRLELSGAPIDTEAKDAQYGIKRIERAAADGLVSTSQSTDAVMAGVEQFDKRYYYLAVHDRDISYDPETPS